MYTFVNNCPCIYCLKPSTFSCIIDNCSLLGDPTSDKSDSVALEGQDAVYFGQPNPSQEQCDSLDLDICPDLLLAFITLVGAGLLTALYIALTMQPNGRRRKRSLPEYQEEKDEIGSHLMQLILHGMCGRRLLLFLLSLTSSFALLTLFKHVTKCLLSFKKYLI